MEKKQYLNDISDIQEIIKKESQDDKAEKEIPEEILCEIQAFIWDKIDSEEKRWKYPEEAYEIANEYCNENFK